MISRRINRTRAILLAAIGGVPLPVLGANVSWIAGSGNWSAGANWGGAVPAPGDFAWIESNDSVDRTVTFDFNYATPLLDLHIRNAGTGTNRLLLATPGSNLASGAMSVGSFGGYGVVQQQDGNVIVTSGVTVGDGANSRGVWDKSGGSLAAQLLNIGWGANASGTMVQTGGWINITQLNNVAMGIGGSGTGSFTLNGSSATLTAAGQVNVGVASGTGSITLNSGTMSIVANGTSTAYSDLRVGYDAGSTGNFAMTGGTLSVARDTVVGSGGTATFTQSGGDHNVAAFLSVAGYYQISTNTARYDMNGGSITSNRLHVNQHGTFKQTSGLTTVTDSLVLYGGTTAANLSLVELAGGLVDCGKLILFTHARVLQTGGEVFVSGTDGARIGWYEYYSGTGGAPVYDLNGGTMSVSYDLKIGLSGVTANFNHTAGSNISNIVQVGAYDSFWSGTNGTGIYNLSGGKAVVNTFIVGHSRAGIMNHTGGTNQSEFLYVGYDGNSNGTYNLSNGTLIVSIGEIIGGPGGSGTGTFNQSGGYHKAGYITLGVESGNPQVFNLSGGDLFTAVVNLNEAGTFNQTGGYLSADYFYQNGGTVTGVLDNRGSFYHIRGAFPGKLRNYGMAEVGSNMVVQAGLENWALLVETPVDEGETVLSGIVIRANQQLTVNGIGLVNHGGMALRGGRIISATGGVSNSFGGVMEARGTIQTDASFFNGGQLDVAGALIKQGTSPLDNVGVVNIGAGRSLQAPGINNLAGVINMSGGSISSTSITNYPGAVIQGGGTLISGVSNNGGLIYATSSTPLLIANLQSNSAGGQLRVDNNATLYLDGIANPNQGDIVLEGSNATLAGVTLNNQGTLMGRGRVNNVVQNNGVIRPEAGQLTLAATVNTNPLIGQIQAPAGGTVFYTQGLASNDGSIALSGGAFDNNNRPITNSATGNIEGGGTFRSGGLTNAGLMNLADINTSVFGAVTNTGSIKITSNTTTFFGFVNNSGGSIKTTSAVARYLGGMSVGGTYISDPSDNYFSGLSITPSGTVYGESGDRFFITPGSSMVNQGNYNVTGTLQAGTITNTGTFLQSGTMTASGPFINNSGTATLAGTQTWLTGSSITVNGGKVIFTSNMATSTVGTLPITVNGGELEVAAGTKLGSLAVAAAGKASIPTAGASKAVAVNSVLLGGVIDLRQHGLAVDYTGATPLTHVRASIIAGFNGGTWTGNGILSLLAVGDSSKAVGYAEASTVLGLSGVQTATFMGQTVDATTVLARYTLTGDADLSGTVNFFDLTALAANYGAATTKWSDGDFNYDGSVNFFDLTALAANYGGALPSQAIPGAPVDFGADLAAAFAQVPEPGSLAWLAASAMFVLGGRRRKAI